MAAEQKTGIVKSLFDQDIGEIIEDESGESRDFYHKGAKVEFAPGDSVNYVLITFPNGKPPVVIDVRKKR